MMNRSTFIRATLLCGGLLLAAAPASAQSTRQTYVDLSASLGYASNPFLALGDDTGSGFVRVSAYGVHAWETERSDTALSAYLENSGNFQRYGNKQIFDLNARTSYRTSETVTLFGTLGFAGDFGGQLGTRFVAAPTTPAAPEPTLPPPVTVIDPTLQSLSGRQYRVSGQVGASIRPNARDVWTISGGAQHLFYTRDSDDLNYTTYSLSGSYDRQLNERLTVGFRTSVQHSEYSRGDSTTIINPQITARARLSESWDASGAVGVIIGKQDLEDGGSDSSVGLSLDGQVCRTGEQSRFCGRLSRYQRNELNANLVTTTSAGADYSYRIDQNQSVQFSASVIHYSGGQILDEDADSKYYVASASYSRKLNDRLSGGLNVSGRKLARFGPDPKFDASGSVFIRYRLGDLQ